MKITDKLLKRQGWRKFRKDQWFMIGKLHGNRVRISLFKDGLWQAIVYENGRGISGEFPQLWLFKCLKGIISFAMTQRYKNGKLIWVK